MIGLIREMRFVLVGASTAPHAFSCVRRAAPNAIDALVTKRVGFAWSTTGISWASVCDARRIGCRRRSSAKADGARERLSFDAG